MPHPGVPLSNPLDPRSAQHKFISMPPSPSVKSISRTKVIVVLTLTVLALPLLVAGQWVWLKFSAPSTVPELKAKSEAQKLLSSEEHK
jgi:hypothetical protein